MNPSPTVRLLRLAACLLLFSALNFRVPTFAQGSLTPPGAPEPTMKTLDQIEARTPISSAPFTIIRPGSYYLTTNLTVWMDYTVLPFPGANYAAFDKIAPVHFYRIRAFRPLAP